MKYLKYILLTLSLTFCLTAGSVSADSLNHSSVLSTDFATSFVGDACSGLSSVSSTGCNNGGNTIKSLSTAVVNILSIIIGVVSVIMLIIAGFRFITANGDANAISSARNTIIYAIVGLVIAVLAQAIVHYVLNSATKIQNNSYHNISRTRDDA